MELDPVIARLPEMGKAQPALETLTVEEARAAMHQRVELLKPLAPQDVETQDLSVATPAGPLPQRPCRPPAPADPGVLATLLWLHGGGRVLGWIDTHDNAWRFLAAERLLVVSVACRLAPELKAQAPRDDTMAALAWAAANDHVPGTTHGFFPMGGLAPMASETLKRAAARAAGVKAAR